MCVCISFPPGSKHKLPNHLDFQLPRCNGSDKKPYTLVAAEERPQGERTWVLISGQVFPK